MNNEQENIQQTTAPNRNSLKFKLLGAAVIILALAVIVYLLSASSKTSPNSAGQSETGGDIKRQTQTYTGSLTGYTSKSSPAGARISLKTPSQFKEVYSNPATNQFMLSQSSGTPPVVVSLIAAIEYAAPDTSPAFLRSYGESLTSAKSANHAAAVKQLNDFVAQRMQNYKITLDTPKAWSNPNIKTAWKASFSASPANSAGASALLTPAMDGEAVVTYGKKMAYYILISNETASWKSNQAVWQQVINSLKIDQ